MRFLKYEIPKTEIDSLLEKMKITDNYVILGEFTQGYIAMDVLWENTEIEDIKQYKVFPFGDYGVGKHVFLGMEELYQKEYEAYINNQII